MKSLGQFSLTKKVVIITGAAGGLGKELVKIIADAKATVVLVDLDKHKVNALAKELNLTSTNSLIHVQDILDTKAIEHLITKTHQQFNRIDVLINAAGVLGPDVLMFDMTVSDWDQILDINLKGTWLMSSAVARYMIEHQIKGNIVNVSSTLGYRAHLKRIAYATSKAGVEHLTRNMAMELVKQNIRVNCFAPGWINTPMVEAILNGPEGDKFRECIPMGRAAEPSELTGALLFLASEASSYMTGHILRIDGGFSYLGVVGPDRTA